MLQKSKFLNKAVKLGKVFPCPVCKTGKDVVTDCEFIGEPNGHVTQKVYYQCRQCKEKSTSHFNITGTETKGFTVEDVKLYVQYE